MPKTHTQFICRSCGSVQPRWMGKCPACDEWDALEEHTAAGGADKHRPLVPPGDTDALVQALAEIQPDSTRRYPSGLEEFDRVLGGGIVPGSAILVGGDPGIGKSTLLLQAGHALAAAKRKTLYVTSEESLGQLRLRAARLGFEDSPLRAAAQTNVDIISKLIQDERPDIVVIDSVQMIYRPELPAAPGSVTQLRDAAARLIWLAKKLNFALLLVGHVTKEGAIAGPKILEHLVDCVAYFEGDRFHAHRLVRTIKNRFGSTDELGIFEMTDAGLAAVPDASKMFLEDRPAARPGSVILAACEGTRTLLVEVQALCAQSVFGSAKRKTTGVDPARTAMILAVLEKHADVVVGDQDVFVNIVGGVKVTEPAADLAIALAVYSAMTGRCLPENAVVFGELGLGGELRPVHHADRRINEAARIGFTTCLHPHLGSQDVKRRPNQQALVCKTLMDAVGQCV